MKNQKHVYILALLSLVVSSACFAKIKLSAIVSSNMVLLRNTTITLWGWADAKEKIVISASWLKESVNIVADRAGNWNVQIQTTGNKKPQTIRIKSSGSDIFLENILLGEDWLCSGQSNMTMPVSGYFGQPVFGAQQAITTFGYLRWNGNRFPTVLFNAMINPLIPYTIKGVIWYQGEANASRPEQYKLLFPAMVKDWRVRWGIGDFPFYYVQIALCMCDIKNRLNAHNNAALMREAQLQCLDLIPNSGIAITLD